MLASAPDAVSQAAFVLRTGEPIVVPTDTVYGLAVLSDLPGATEMLFALKRRSARVPLAVLCADVDQALDLVDQPTDRVKQVANKYWPGPLTLVLPRRPGLGYELGEPATTIGVRCPDHDLVRALAAEVGPIATTSANPHGQPTPPDAAGVRALFGDSVRLILDGGLCTGEPSTVVDATTDDWIVLRQGALEL